VRLSDIRHTNGFRVGLLFAAMFTAASLVLCALAYWGTSYYLSSLVNAWMAQEIRGRAVVPARTLQRTLDARTAAEPDKTHLIALFASDAHWIAGDRAVLPSPLPGLDRPFAFTMLRDGVKVPFRGMLHRLPSGEVLLAAREMLDIDGFREALAGALMVGGAIFLILGLSGAVIAGLGALSRIDRVTRTIERIVNGNLNERLPSDGGGGAVDLLIQVVNSMLDEIERLMDEVKGVTDNIAHDLRTPLTRLLAGLERVRRRGTSIAGFETAIDEAIADAKGILRTFTALLRIAEVESGARRSGFKIVDLDTVAADVTELYEPLAEGKSISLLLETARGGNADIAGDSSLIFEALSNLVDNAIKYSPSDSRVLVRVCSTADRLGVEVSDTGPGIPEADREAVVQRFHRLDRGRATPGSGLGLSLVAAVANLHDFHLAIEDAHPGCRVVLWRERAASTEPRPVLVDHLKPAQRV
jgi:signal transduction histidine kinase